MQLSWTKKPSGVGTYPSGRQDTANARDIRTRIVVCICTKRPITEKEMTQSRVTDLEDLPLLYRFRSVFINNSHVLVLPRHREVGRRHFGDYLKYSVLIYMLYNNI